MAKTSPLEFLRQVRQEVGRVTWPTRKETATTTIMVFAMVFIAAFFFFVVDEGLGAAVRWALNLGA
jgi:preprotein translocase subunit SecE